MAKGSHVNSKTETICVSLVEPHPLAAKHLKSLLQTRHSIRLLSYEEVFADLDCGRNSASVVLIDAGSLDGSLKGNLGFLRARFSNARILVIGRPITTDELCHLILLGMRGFVCYEDVDRALVQAIDAVSLGKLWIPVEVLERFAEYIASLAEAKGSRNDLTGREKDILIALGKKLSNKEIAGELGISERTVKFHLENVFGKLGVHDRHSVAKLAASHQAAELFGQSKA